VGYNLGKRLTDLRKQTDEELSGRWHVKRTTFFVLILLILARFFILPLSETPSSKRSEQINQLSEDQELPPEIENEDLWIKDILSIVHERVLWLENSPLILLPGTANIYEDLAKTMDSFFTLTEDNSTKESDAELDMFYQFSDIPLWFNRMIVGTVLRVAFILSFLPLWLLGGFAGYFLVRMQIKKPLSPTLLGVCDRGNGPFYSGIYGPFKPNNSFSGTNLSAPGLACPAMADKTSVEKHKLAEFLKTHEALNETNIELLQVIFAHPNYPHVVAEESSIHQEESSGEIHLDLKVSQTGFVSNEKGTLLSGVERSLPSVLEAHTIAIRYVNSLKKQKHTSKSLNGNYPSHIAALEKLVEPLSELSKRLLLSMTPDRLWAIAEISPQLLASAYLAIEAGKALVYKPHGPSYTRISLYPHLQARAVIQALVPYHEEYTGDERLIARQAIISSRRHGDFGRAFLPIRMPLQSRALRDWLEILYAEPERQSEVASLVELDSNIEEIHVNFRTRLTDRIKGDKNAGPTERFHQLWKGLAYKSVVLLPVKDLVKIALADIHQSRLEKIALLLDVTRKYQTQITTSARLPGFKRQAMEATESGEQTDIIVQKIKALPNGTDTYNKWRIVRRMLTKYNWLSTRIGDDSVPLVGVVHGILKHVTKDHLTKYLFMDALAPLRQRRFTEILGKHWEHTYYRYSPTQEDIDIFTQTEEYENQLRSFKAEPAPEELKIIEKEHATG